MKQLPSRKSVRERDTWDLSSLYATEAAWEKDFARFKRFQGRYGQYRGKLSQSSATLAACLRFDSKVERLGERLGTYAFLRTAEDQANSEAQSLVGRYQSAAARLSEEASFIRPELLSMAATKLRKLMQDEELAPYRLLIERITRYRPHTLSDREEQLLAMQAEMSQAAGKAFRQLLDADMTFGAVTDESGKQCELSHATFMQFLHSPQRPVRKQAFHQYYAEFQAHENTLAATLAGSVHRDIYYARARGYDSALQSALFHDDVPLSVYDNLIAEVRRHLPAVHRYYDVRRRKMRLKKLHHYDTYVPILADLQTKRSWDQAVKTVLTALAPLGEDYGRVLHEGLTGRWCDRYPNKGKQSGAFSCGTFDGDPYILMNYKPEVLDDVFTLAHEAGHSMHSHYSAKHQPFEYYNYTIFVAEVASTFNEQLLSRHLMAQARDDHERAYLINREIDSIRATIVRQTMFAEFEKLIHAHVEHGEPLTVATLKRIYGDLLTEYFGPEFAIDDCLQLEGLRIPHFYRAFYVYKYATGLSAAIALSRKVLRGTASDLEAYLGFLKSGCSKFPLELLRDAGVDMERPEPVRVALQTFTELVEQLDTLV